MKLTVIITVPPYADFLEEVAAHPLVSGFRLNTVMPFRDSPGEVLERLRALGQPMWVDLKGRQLRVVGAAIPPYTEVRLSHRIKVQTPVDAYLSDGNERVRVAAVDGDRLIFTNGSRRLIGPGESINIVHQSLEIEGTLTDTDRAYLSAMGELDMKQVMLSYVQSPADVDEVRSVLPDAKVMLKIETPRGLDFARKYGTKHGRLVAVRGDLYVEIIRPHKIVGALKTVIQADPQAVVGSRILESLAFQPVPICADIGDVAFLLEIGYRTFMLGDVVCLKRETVLEALNLLEELALSA